MLNPKPQTETLNPYTLKGRRVRKFCGGVKSFVVEYINPNQTETCGEFSQRGSFFRTLRIMVPYYVGKLQGSKSDRDMYEPIEGQGF